MRKLALLVGLIALVASTTGCNCFRQNQNQGGGLFGFGMFGHRQPMVGSYAPGYYSQPVAQAAIPCCPQPMAVECCYDPCQQPGMMMGAPTHVFGDGANCCN